MCLPAKAGAILYRHLPRVYISVPFIGSKRQRSLIE
jgi:hypothetical protein